MPPRNSKNTTKKPMDEDRARRKQVLVEKRAARKQQQRQQRQRRRRQEAATATVTTITTRRQQQQPTSTTTTTTTTSCRLQELPAECMERIIICCDATDLGRLCLLNHWTVHAVATSQVWQSRRTTMIMKTSSSSNSNNSSNDHHDDDWPNNIQSMPLVRGNDKDSNNSKKKKKNDDDDKTCLTRALHRVAYLHFLDRMHARHCLLLLHNKKLVRSFQNCGGLVSVSPEHSLLIHHRQVSSWGVGRRGQLGHGVRTDVRVPTRIPNLPISIVQVSAGGGLVRVAHSLFLDTTGRVYSCGTGQYGALGHGYSAAKQLPDLLRPTLVSSLHVAITYVAAGELHSAVVSVDGDVYTWGDGFCGQLGLGSKRPALQPSLVQGVLEDECVATVHCGSRHTVAVTEDGEVYSWGLGHFGALGRSYTAFDYDADASVVALGEGPGGVPGPLPAAAAAVQREPRDGLDHIDLIANLSLDDSSDQCVPKQIDSLRDIPIIGASAGHRHTLLLSRQGAVYACGTGKAGCLGLGTVESQKLPVRIQQFDQENAQIWKVSAGVDMSMAVARDGRTYAWGHTDGGRNGLGLGTGDVLLPQRVDCRTTSGKPVVAVDVECGYVHSLILSRDGSLYMCGGVGVEGEADGQRTTDNESLGLPTLVEPFNAWQRVVAAEKKEVKKARWKKFGKYEVKGRSKMLNETYEHSFSSE